VELNVVYFYTVAIVDWTPLINTIGLSILLWIALTVTRNILSFDFTYINSTSFLRSHHRALPLILLIAGFATIILGHIFTKGWHEAIIVPTGGIMIAVAHFVNYKYVGTCQAGNSFLHVKHSPNSENIHV
jgi:hypothetical protein